jgi:hypothetical protein
MTEKTPARVRGYLSEYAERYPGAWKMYDSFVAARGRGLPDWPEWCWCPLAASYAIVSGGGPNRVPLERMSDVGILGALAAWRMTQGIYRFDSDMFSALWSTPLDGDLPRELLYYLPEWCVYIEAPEGYAYHGAPLAGWFAHLEYDAETRRPELRLVLDLAGQPLAPFTIHLTRPTLEENLDAVFAEASRQAAEHGIDYAAAPDVIAAQRAAIGPVVSVLLYLCSEAADISDMRGRREAPGNPEPKKTKRGFRVFPRDGETTWLVGYRIGASLRLADRQGAGTGTGTHASPVPHMRRAHWHSFWTGPRAEPAQRKLAVRWLPPIPVGAGEILPTIRKVE